MRHRLMIGLVLAATVAAAAEQVPRLDPQATGTGAIVGRVVEAGTETPVANARVWLRQTRGEIRAGVYTRSEGLTTDSSGAFAFHSLPAGQFGVEASADGYQSGAIGRRRPEAEEVWVTLKDGQTFSHATIELFRGGTISGVVTNDRGEPLKEVHVETWFRTSNGQMTHRYSSATNVAGTYRMSGVPAGDYLVVARVSHDTVRQGPPATEPSHCSRPAPPPPSGVPFRPVVVEKPKHAEGEWFTSVPRWIPELAPDDQGQPRTIPTTIYPGVREVSQASIVSILGGEDRTGIDLQFRPVATTTIQGRILPLQGKRIGKGSEVRLRLPEAPSALSEHRTWVQPDNTFRFLGVPAGSYVLEVQLQESVSCDVIVRDSDDVLTQVPLDVPPDGLEDVVVSISSGVTMQGRIRLDGRRGDRM